MWRRALLKVQLDNNTTWAQKELFAIAMGTARRLGRLLGLIVPEDVQCGRGPETLQRDRRLRRVRPVATVAAASRARGFLWRLAHVPPRRQRQTTPPPHCIYFDRLLVVVPLSIVVTVVPVSPGIGAAVTSNGRRVAKGPFWRVSTASGDTAEFTRLESCPGRQCKGGGLSREDG